MNILAAEGTRYAGIRPVNQLLSEGGGVTAATRGKTPDNFGSRVQRLVLERADPQSIAAALAGKAFDAVYGSVAFSSNEGEFA